MPRSKHHKLTTHVRTIIVHCVLLLSIFILFSSKSFGSPLYSRQYSISCSTCHHAPPKLNIFGERFKLTSSLPNWESNTSIDTGDISTAVPKIFPLSLHTQMLVSTQRGYHISDYSSGQTSHNSNVDIKTPSLVKLISSAPLTDNISYYFDARMHPNENGSALVVGESWLRYRTEGDVIATITAGQFPASDAITDQDTRMTLKNYLIYLQSGMKSDHSIRADVDFEYYLLSFGISNGNSVESIAMMNSPGFGRDEVLYDRNDSKSVHSYIAKRYKSYRLGYFWQVNQQPATSDLLADKTLSQQSYHYINGFDIQAYPSNKVSWMLQLIWNQWQNIVSAGDRQNWYGGFVSIDYAASSTIAYSLLYNLTHAGDFYRGGTVYEGLEANAVTTTVSYYFRSNVRGIFEITMDFLPQDIDKNFVGHESKEDMISVGIDLNY